MGVHDDVGVAGEDGGEEIAVEKGQISHEKAGGEGAYDSADEGLFRPSGIARAHVLRHERGHGLHIGGRHQHDEGTDLLCHADTGGGRDAERVDDGLDHEKGDADEKFLQCDRCAELQLLDDERFIEAQIVP